MNFMGIGPMEVMVIITVAIIILGPAKAVDMAKSAGKMAREVRRSFADLSSTLEKEKWDESTDNPRIQVEPKPDNDRKASQ